MERSIVMADLPEIRLTQAPLDLADVPTALIADCDRAPMAIGAPMTCMSKRSRFVGEALTIRAGSLAQWKALELAQPGQVLVISCNGRRDRAEFGAVFVQVALAKGIAAIVTDGLLRDRDEIAALELPVFACGTHPASPADPTPGGIGLQLRLHEAVIDWGDIIVGDDDGLVVIPRAAMNAVLEKVSMQRLREHELQQSLLGAVRGQLPERIRTALSKVSLAR